MGWTRSGAIAGARAAPPAGATQQPAASLPHLHCRPVLRCTRVVGIQVPPLCKQDAHGVQQLRQHGSPSGSQGEKIEAGGQGAS